MALYERMPDFQDEEVLSQAEELELVEGCVPLLSSIRIAVKSLRLAIVEDIVDPSALEDEIFHVFIKPARALRPTPRIDTWEVTDVDVDDIRRYYLGPTVWINKLRDALSESPPDLDPKSRTGVLWKLKECQRETDKALALLDVKTFVRQARQHLQSNDEESWKNASDALEHAHLVAMAEIYRTGDNPRYQGIAPAISLMDQSIAR